jgi:hypothetical protein
MALPFFRTYRGQLIHRVRSGRIYLYDGEYSHTSVSFWCGNTGSQSPKKPGEFFAEAPERAVHCAICEGKAVGAGMCGARVICGRTVLFQPRI